MQDPTTTEVYKACLSLYLRYNGRSVSRIERELRARGHEFHRRTLYNRGKSLGWIARYNWQTLVKGERLTDKGESEEPCESLRCESPRVSKGDIRTQQEETSRNASFSGGVSVPACVSDSENTGTEA